MDWLTVLSLVLSSSGSVLIGWNSRNWWPFLGLTLVVFANLANNIQDHQKCEEKVRAAKVETTISLMKGKKS